MKVYNEHGMAQRNGMGMFPREVVNRFPLLPVEEEGRLNDLPLRENFIERVFAYYRWTEMLDEEPTPGGLVKFHTAHKLSLMAHSTKHYTEMGRLVADAGKRDWEELIAEYGAMLMEGLSVMGKRGKHVNVLQHLMGFLKNHISSEDKQELLGLIEDYRQGLLPLIVPLTLLKHHLNRHPVPDWVDQQVYLNPYPKELMLRNHV
ncbi:YbgA family protein [Chloroflexota bacterium]